MTRVFYWINGVPKDRVGGPWWCREFQQDKRAMEFVQEMSKSALCKAVKYVVYNIGDDIPDIDHRLIEPPEGAKEIK